MVGELEFVIAGKSVRVVRVFVLPMAVEAVPIVFLNDS
jgi:hypothetical protein